MSEAAANLPANPPATSAPSREIYFLAATADLDPIDQADFLTDAQIAEQELSGLKLPKMIGNQPVHYFRKDLIYPRIYEGKKKDGQPFTLSASLPRIKNWIAKDNAMLDKGLDVPAVNDHKETAENTRGYLKKFWLGAKNRMQGLFQFIGDKDALLASRNRVSVAIDPDYVDDAGQQWGEVIRHVALTPKGIVSNQGDWVAMSEKSDKREVVLLSSSDEWRPNMADDEMMPCSAAQISAIDKHVPGFAAKPKEQRMDHLIDHLHRASRGMHMLSTTIPESETDLLKLIPLVETAHKAAINEAKKPAEVVEMSAAQIDIEKNRTDIYHERIDLAVAKGMSPTRAAKLKAALPKDKPNMMLLSAAEELGGRRAIDFILDLEAGETPAVDRDKKKMPSQVLPLSAAGTRDRTPEEMAEANEKMSMDRRNELREHAGLPAITK